GDDGIATATLTDAVAETVQATATIAQGTVNGSPVSVTFDAGLFSYSKSTFTVTPVADTSDTTTWVPVSDGTGTDYYTGVLTAMDADGNLLDSLTLTDIAFTASSTDVTVTSVTNTGNGTYSVQFSSEVADATTTASVTYKTSPVGLAQPIPFVAGAPVPGPVVCPDASKTGTNVSASPTELAVDDDSTITALVTDQYCNPVSGVPVTFGVVTPTSGTITTVIGTTGADGIATATLTDTVSETVQATATITQGTVNGSPVSVTFDAGLFSYTKSTFTVTPVANLSDQSTWVAASTGASTYTGTLTAKDGDGNLLDNLTLTDIAFAASTTDVTVTSVTNTGNGTYSVQYSSTVADATPTATVTYKATAVGTALPIPFKAGTAVTGPVTCPDATKTGTNVSANPTEVAVDDTSTITALITDQYCNPVSGATVTFGVVTPTSGTITTVVGTTGANGIATATLTDTVSETVQATATITQGPVYGSPVSVTFDAGLFSYTKSTFTVTPVANLSDQSTWVTASTGASTYTGTLTAKDGDGNPLNNLTLTDIAFAASSGTVAITTVVNNHDGTYTVTYSSTAADPSTTATVTYKATAVGTALPIPFKAGTAVTGPVTCPDATKTGTNVSASPTEVAVDDTSTITALITDQYCNPVSGVPVTFGVVTPTSGVITTVIGTTGANGIATATLTDTVSETVQATATITQGPVYGSPVSVTFDAGLFSSTTSTFAVTPVVTTTDQSGWITASTGATYYIGTLTAKDSDGNLLPTLAVSDIAFAASSANVAITTVVNNHDGTYTVKYSSSVADPSTTATVTYKSSAVGTALPIPFKAGTAVPGPITCADPTKTGTNVSASPTQLGVGDTSTITALITDQYCNPVSGATVAFATISPTNGTLTTVKGTTGTDGIATATLTDTTAETVRATATIPQGTVSGSPVSVTFSTGVFSYTMSTFTVTPLDNPADESTWIRVSTGSVFYTGILTAKDSAGNLLPNLNLADIQFSASTPDVKITPVVNNNDGTYTVHFSSTLADPTATVTYRGVPVGSPVPIMFESDDPVPGPVVCPDPAMHGTNLSVDQTQLPVGELAHATALITDEFCNPVAGVVVTFSTSPTSTGVLVPSATTGPDGVATATLTDTAGETVALHAMLGTTDIFDSPQNVTFVQATPAPTITMPGSNADLNTATPTLSGTGTTPGDTITVKDAQGATVCTTTVTPAKTWTCPVPAPGLGNGTHTLRATETDSYNQVSAPSTPLTLTVDTIPPSQPTVTQANKTAISGTVPGTNNPGTTVTITYPKSDGTTGSVTVPMDTTTNTWTTSTPSDAVSGPITVIATDPAGNTSPTATATLDVTAPQQPTVTTANTKQISGTVPGNNNPGTTVTVTYKTTNGTTATASTTINPDGSWSMTTPSDAVTGPITVIATDPAGNTSPTATATLDLTVPQNATITQANKAGVAGTVPGSNEPGTTVTITWPDGSTTTGVQVNADGTWSVPTPSGMPSGTISVTATNPAGNSSTPVTAFLDTSTPAAPTVNPTNGTEISGTADAGGTVHVTDSSGATIPGCDNVQVGDDGTFACHPTTPLEPGTVVNVSVTSKAGNPSSPTQVTIQVLTIEVAYPTLNPMETQTVTGYPFNQGEQVCLTMPDDSLSLGCGPADDQGMVSISFTVPSSMSIGAHVVRLTGEVSGWVETSFDVTVVPTVPTGGAVVESQQFPFGVLFAGSIMVVAGLWMTSTVRRHRDRHHLSTR
ncbi:MAG: Ig-like domain-containing protein, partial [Propionibacteriaceae bacterium]|nr:Ig-like domain-containing protein [Propionibacteriaceae bacterium]